jgi:hypothetical protein
MNITRQAILTSIAVAAGAGPSAEARAPSAQEAALAFVAAGDRQDIAGLDQVLHPSFRVLFVTAGKTGETELSRAQYLQLVRDKKLGGDTRTVEVVSAETVDRVSFLRLRIRGKQSSFETLETWVEVGERWLLASDHVVFSPEKG